MSLSRFAVVLLTGALMLKTFPATAQTSIPIAAGWQLQDVAKVTATPELISTAKFKPADWYTATVPGTVLTTLVDNKVYPEPLYGENMRLIPESLNKTSYWYRTTFAVPASYKARHTWLHFGGINYSSEIWVNGQRAGTTRGAFIRTDLDISALVKPGTTATLAILVAPQPHPGIPVEHTVANGVGKNGGDTAIPLDHRMGLAPRRPRPRHRHLPARHSLLHRPGGGEGSGCESGARRGA
jgi:beta-mannosidase